MKNKMKQFVILRLLPCFVALLLFQTQAYAEEKVYCTASIPVEIKTLGDSVPSGIEYKVVIKSENETNPMPDVKEVTIKDNGKVEIGPMTYTKPGRYNYFISQEAGNAEHFTYDSAVYTVTVSIENDGNGGLKSVIYAVENGATEKTDDVVFFEYIRSGNNISSDDDSSTDSNFRETNNSKRNSNSDYKPTGKCT